MTQRSSTNRARRVTTYPDGRVLIEVLHGGTWRAEPNGQVDPVCAAQRALDALEPETLDGAEEAIRELAHGLASLARTVFAP